MHQAGVVNPVVCCLGRISPPRALPSGTCFTVTRTPLPMGKAIPTRAFLLALALPLTRQSLSPESFFKRIISQDFRWCRTPDPGLHTVLHKGRESVPELPFPAGPSSAPAECNDSLGGSKVVSNSVFPLCILRLGPAGVRSRGGEDPRV